MAALANIETLPMNTITVMALGILLTPLFTFVILILFGRIIHKFRGIVATVLMFLCMLIAYYILFSTWEQTTYHSRWVWFDLGKSLQFTLGVQLDNLSVFMLTVVTTVSFLVHLFSIEYLRGDRDFEKYFAYLGLFTFSMIGIVLSDNLFSIFVFWELVGLSSYLLIGFYYQKEEAVYANKKAFIANRVGDAGFLIGLMVLWALSGTLDLEQLQLSLPALAGEHHLLIVAGLGVMCGAIGKSAQFPLQVWLPNAMEGPTPVSALIHAATMVAAGIYLLARTYFMMQPEVLTVIAFIGGLTAFMGAVAALAQTDIKRVLAFSTISQLGYMMMGMGVGSYDAALFHLLTHAFFKACLFLAAGAVIHSMHDLEHKLHKDGVDVHFDPQDMRVMGGLRKRMPVTFITYTVATLALAGLPFTSGFLSKDAILVGAYSWAEMRGGTAYLIPFLGFVSALMTAFYMGRQMFMVFYGEFRLEQLNEKLRNTYHLVIETPWLMRIPLIVLSMLSLGIFYSSNPLDGAHSWFIAALPTPNPSLKLLGIIHSNHLFVSVLSSCIGIIGLGVSYLIYVRGIVVFKEGKLKDIIRGISLENWYLDDLYEKSFVNGSIVLSKASSFVDRCIVDQLVNAFGVVNVVVGSLIATFDKHIVDGSVSLLSRLMGGLGSLLRKQHSGKAQSYVLVSVVVVLVILTFIVFDYL